MNIFFTAEFMGATTSSSTAPRSSGTGDDGGKSVQESDCQPFAPGTKIERFTGRPRVNRKAGVYNIKATFRRP